MRAHYLRPFIFACIKRPAFDNNSTKGGYELENNDNYIFYFSNYRRA